MESWNAQAVRQAGSRVLELNDEHPRTLMGRVVLLEAMLRRLANRSIAYPNEAVEAALNAAFDKICRPQLDMPVDQGDESLVGIRAEARFIHTILSGEGTE